MNTNKNVSPKTAEAVENQEAAVSQPDIQSRMEAGKVEVMKVVGGIPGAEKLGELIERGKKKGNLSSSELMDVLEDMDGKIEAEGGGGPLSPGGGACLLYTPPGPRDEA